MTIEQLVQKLIKFPKNMEVHLHGYEHITHPVRFVSEDNVWAKKEDSSDYIRTEIKVVKIS